MDGTAGPGASGTTVDARGAAWFVDERSRFYVAGWAQNLRDHRERPKVKGWLRCGCGERVLAQLRAKEFSEPLFKLDVGDGYHGFFVAFETPAVEYRSKIFFTTNLARRQPDSYFEFLSTSGIHHISVSVDSFDKAIYEKMRKGAHHEMFLENLDRLTSAFAKALNPPKLRFVTLASRRGPVLQRQPL